MTNLRCLAAYALSVAALRVCIAQWRRMTSVRPANFSPTRSIRGTGNGCARPFAGSTETASLQSVKPYRANLISACFQSLLEFAAPRVSNEIAAGNAAEIPTGIAAGVASGIGPGVAASVSAGVPAVRGRGVTTGL